MRSKRIYVAGPYSKGDVALNVRAAIMEANMLAEVGYVPFIPHLSHFWHLLCPHDWEFWMKQDMQWLETCDCVLRLPGKSVGADQEVERAQELGIPVYWSMREAFEKMNEGART